LRLNCAKSQRRRLERLLGRFFITFRRGFVVTKNDCLAAVTWFFLVYGLGYLALVTAP
jgi:hypothetical protein